MARIQILELPNNSMERFAKGGKKNWIQKATASIKRRGTSGVCTGSKFGSSSCPSGSKRYTLAKTFKKIARNRKHEYGGLVMYPTGGEVATSTSSFYYPEVEG